MLTPEPRGEVREVPLLETQAVWAALAWDTAGWLAGTSPGACSRMGWGAAQAGPAPGPSQRIPGWGAAAPSPAQPQLQRGLRPPRTGDMESTRVGWDPLQHPPHPPQILSL